MTKQQEAEKLRFQVVQFLRYELPEITITEDMLTQDNIDYVSNSIVFRLWIVRRNLKRCVDTFIKAILNK